MAQLCDCFSEKKSDTTQFLLNAENWVSYGRLPYGKGVLAVPGNLPGLTTAYFLISLTTYLLTKTGTTVPGM